MRILSRPLLILAVATLLAGSASKASAQSKPDPKVEKERTEIRKMAYETLTRLYKLQPDAKRSVEKAAGYAVFSDKGVKILVSGSGRGRGVAMNNRTRAETFMKMFELQVGLGFGVKKFKVIFVFDTEQALQKFVDSGWEFGGQSDAAIKAGDGKGASIAGAASVSDGVWMYQLTDKGLALEITMKGTKYYKDDALNARP